MPSHKKTKLRLVRQRGDLARGNDMYVLNFFLPRKRHLGWRRYVLLFLCMAAFIMTFNHLAVTNSTTASQYRRRAFQTAGLQASDNDTKKPAQIQSKAPSKTTTFWRWFKKPIFVNPLDSWQLIPEDHSFKYIHNNEYICHNLDDNRNKSDLLLVIFVNSAPKNVAKRAYIRKTFGNASSWPSDHGFPVMRLVFLIAGVNNTKLQEDIHYESIIYNDIVQESFTDNYLNMTRKTIMGMKWVTKFCRWAKYTMKIDDDILLNIPRLLEIISLAPATNFTYGTVHWAKPIRSPTGALRKFYTPKRVFTAKRYPPYLNGHAYLMSTDVVEKIYEISKTIDLFPWSDVFVGMCIEKLGIRLRHSELFVSMGFRKENKTTFKTKENYFDIMREYVTIYHQPFEAMDQIWTIWNKKI